MHTRKEHITLNGLYGHEHAQPLPNPVDSLPRYRRPTIDNEGRKNGTNRTRFPADTERETLSS